MLISKDTEKSGPINGLLNRLSHIYRATTRATQPPRPIAPVITPKLRIDDGYDYPKPEVRFDLPATYLPPTK